MRLIIFNYGTALMAIVLALIPLSASAAILDSLSKQELERMRSKYAASANMFIPQLMLEGEVPGMQLAVLLDGELFYEGAFGVTNEDTKQRVDTNTVFAAASLGKPVFAYAVVKLAHHDGFDLDRPLAQILPCKGLEQDKRARRITARMILAHTSGIPHSYKDGAVLLCEPADEFHYSPAAYDYLQLVIEEVTGLTLNEFATREVFEPLGMTRSAYYFREDFAGNSIYGHSIKGPARHISFMSEMQQNASTTLLTTARDYARFLQAMIDPAEDDMEVVEEMLIPHVQVKEDMDGHPMDNMFWGLGWGIEQEESGRAIWHWGDLGMFKNYVICFPESGFGLVYFTNGDSGLAIGRKLTSVMNAGDDEPFNMLGIQDYSAPGWKSTRMRQRNYLKGNITAGEGLYF